MIFYNDRHYEVFVARPPPSRSAPGRFRAGESATFSFEFDCRFAPGPLHAGRDPSPIGAAALT